MTDALDAFVRRRADAASSALHLAELAAEVDPEGAARLAATARRVAAGRFVVLLVGCFSSGKSTLLNALLGQPVLPVKVNPCTAILTDVAYGDAPSVTVRFRDGGETAMSIAEFVQAYQLETLADAAGAEATDRFGAVDRAVVRWPLPLLAHGVVLVDTPGLDDDPVRTHRTLSSLPDADAVIFVLSATRFLSDLERRTLRQELLPLGLRNLFFPVTMVDLLDALVPDPIAERARMHDRAAAFVGPLCQIDGADRFAERYAPVDARAALAARWDRTAAARREPPDADALARCGMSAFEEHLTRFLVDERGAAQLAHLGHSVERLRADLVRRAAVDRATAEDSIAALRARHDAQQPRLRELEAIAARVSRTIDAFIARQQQAVFHQLRAFVAETEAKLPDAVANVDLGGLAAIDLLRPGGRSRVEARLRDQLHAWLDGRMAEWQTALRPSIEAALTALKAELTADAHDFDRLVADIVTGFAGATLTVPEASTTPPPVDPVERWFSVAVGAALLSPGAMAAGWSDGYEGALKGAAGRLGVRIAVLTLGALLGPIGWAGVALYVASDAVLFAITGGGQLGRLRQQVAEQLRGQLVAQVDADRDALAARIADGFRPLRDALVGAADDEAKQLADLLTRTVAERERLQADAAARRATWDRVLAAFPTPR